MPAMKKSPSSTSQFLALAIAAIPVLALTVGIPLANHVQPLILGMPFFVVYQVFWVLLTPGFLYFADKTRKPK